MVLLLMLKGTVYLVYSDDEDQLDQDHDLVNTGLKMHLIHFIFFYMIHLAAMQYFYGCSLKSWYIYYTNCWKIWKFKSPNYRKMKKWWRLVLKFKKSNLRFIRKIKKKIFKSLRNLVKFIQKCLRKITEPFFYKNDDQDGFADYSNTAIYQNKIIDNICKSHEHLNDYFIK